MNHHQIYTDQVAASLVQEGIRQSEEMLQDRLTEIQQIAIEKSNYARTAFSKSLDCIENARDFVQEPTHILGRMQTKHGEIAEHIEVEIRNGRNILQHLKQTATFEGVGRTAPEDYIINNELVQSKFINSANKSLDHVLGHLKTYPGFTDKGFYQIPKDQYEIISRISSGQNVEGLHSSTIKKCNDIIKAIEEESGKKFSEVVKPGISTYNEVQLGKVDETLSKYEKEFQQTHKQEMKSIRDEKAASQSKAQHITDPSWGEALKYSGIAAVISGSTSAVIKIYSKIHNGTKITEFTLEDWKEIGYDFAKGGAKGAISGLGIYSLTKICGFSAPFAGAMVSSAMGILSLLNDYKKGNISKSEFSDSAMALSTESALSAVGAAVGQALIPIPVLGAIIGSVISKSALEITKYLLGKDEEKLISKMEADNKILVERLNSDAKVYIDKIESYFAKMDGFINCALSKDAAIKFAGSIKLCRHLGIDNKEILHSIEDVDRFILG